MGEGKVGGGLEDESCFEEWLLYNLHQYIYQNQNFRNALICSFSWRSCSKRSVNSSFTKWEQLYLKVRIDCLSYRTDLILVKGKVVIVNS